jgi:hypothetical protein
MASGFVSLALIGIFLSPTEQGFYFAFASILGLQIFFELGLTSVVLQFASHEKAFLSWTEAGTLEGEPHAKARLASLALLTRRWYAWLAALACATIVVSGWWYFHTHGSSATGIEWQLPWCVLVLAAAGNLLVSPFIAIIEGCGEVVSVAKLRIAQAFVSNVSFWIAMTAGAGLFAAPILPAMTVVTSVGWLAVTRRSFYADLLKRRIQTPSLSWRHEVWPLQWRIAVSWMSGYFISQLFTPVIFAVHGPVAAGQFGMSMTIATSITALAIGWQNTKLPAAGALIAQRDFPALNRLFFPALKQSTLLVIVIALSVWCADAALRHWNIPFAGRLLPPLPFGFLLAAAVVNHVVYCEALYLRAHLREPFLGLSILNATLCTMVVWLGAKPGFTVLATGYFLVNLVVGLGGGTWIFFRKRREWHNAASPDAGAPGRSRWSFNES